MNDKIRAEADAVADLTRAGLDPAERSVETARGAAILLTGHDGAEVLRLVDEAVQDGAITTRIVEDVTVETEDSLAAYLNRFKGPSALLFAALSSNTIVAVVDYHEARAGDAYVPTDDLAYQHGGHVVSLKLPFSLEWQEWTGQDNKLQPQLDFVRFLEDVAEDIIEPDAATVLEACRDLTTRRKVDFTSWVRENSDNVKFEFKEEVAGSSRSGEIEIPSKFVISIPVYFGGPKVEVEAILRWKLDEERGGLTIGYKLRRAERIRQDEFKRVTESLTEATGVPHVYGKRA